MFFCGSGFLAAIIEAESLSHTSLPIGWRRAHTLFFRVYQNMVRAVRNALVKYLPQSPMGRTGCVACLAAALLAWVDLRLAVIPLGIFMVLCLVAPFMPSSSFFLPVISRGTCNRKAVALTFDDGPDPLTTPELLRLLKKYRMTGTFFVTGHRVVRHPQLIREILAKGHSLANHSFHHDPWGAFRSVQTMKNEIKATQQALKDLGIVTLAYRPPMGITSPRLRRVMQEEGMFVVNFSCRAWDGGNRRIRNLSRSILNHVRTNDILLLHDNLAQPSLFSRWAGEVDRVLRGIPEKGLAILPLADLIGRPVMIASGDHDEVHRGPNSEHPAMAGADMKTFQPTHPEDH
jgi:peptidoglycan-N-acetylglucosamine deacetylase